MREYERDQEAGDNESADIEMRLPVQPTDFDGYAEYQKRQLF